MANAEKASRVLRWVGALFTVAGGVNAFVPVDECGTALQPNGPDSGTVICNTLISSQWETVWLLGGLGVVLMLIGQAVGWRKRA